MIKVDKLENQIKKIVKEAFDKEMMKIRAELLQYISEKEQRDIELLYGKPKAQKAAKSRKIKI